MRQENAGLFEEFDGSDGARGDQSLSGEFRIRPAKESDIGSLGRISAVREGGTVREHVEGFRRELEVARTQHTAMVFVAELDDRVIGYGRTGYLHKEHGGAAGESPVGWYLTGMVVTPEFRRCGVGTRLTAERLAWISERSRFAYYFANARNRVSIALHDRFGFAEIARGPELCGQSFLGGEGILFEVDLSRSAWRAA
jgi:GNAT superfamily N-acetyltransferase